jgi:cytochrome c oxidase subunit 3
MATETKLQPTPSHDSNAPWSGGQEPFKASYGKLMMWYFLLSDAFTFAGFLIAYGALKFSVPTWPVPDFVFSTFPFYQDNAPLIFVTVMSFVLIASSVTMVRAVQEGKRENKNGVVFWMTLTIIGGLTFLGCQAYEWNTLISHEHMTVSTNPFGTHTDTGVYLNDDGTVALNEDGSQKTFKPGDSYLIHQHNNEWHPLKFRITEGPDSGQIKNEEFGPKAFGSLFFFITGFHGFHVLSGIIFLIIITINAASGVYVKRRNGYEMIEKIGLYWHFVDLVWVFVFLLFYLL